MEEVFKGSPVEKKCLVNELSREKMKRKVYELLPTHIVQIVSRNIVDELRKIGHEGLQSLKNRRKIDPN